MQNEQTIKNKLATSYHIMSYLGMDDHTYTHLSSRAGDSESFYIYPFGFRFEEVTSDDLMRISFDGEVLEGSEFQYNKTGYMIHGTIYKSRPDLNSIFHFHNPEVVAVASVEEGLMPISQWALHFYGKIAYHDYDSLALDYNTSNKIVSDMQDKKVVMMRNHGAITSGSTIEEAMFYSYHLLKACQAQCFALSMNKKIITPSKEICEKAVKDLLSFESNLGERDWQAWTRLVEKNNNKIN